MKDIVTNAKAFWRPIALRETCRHSTSSANVLGKARRHDKLSASHTRVERGGGVPYNPGTDMKIILGRPRGSLGAAYVEAADAVE